MRHKLGYIALIAAMLAAGLLAFITWETSGGRERCLEELKGLPKRLAWYAQDVCNKRYGKP
jgi:hypothetical protein